VWNLWWDGLSMESRPIRMRGLVISKYEGEFEGETQGICMFSWLFHREIHAPGDRLFSQLDRHSSL
jgi:hypothetical protein